MLAAGTLTTCNRPLDSVEALDIITGAWSTLEPDAIPPEAVAESKGEVLCEYTEQSSEHKKNVKKDNSWCDVM